VHYWFDHIDKLNAWRDQFLYNRFNHILNIVIILFITAPFLQADDTITLSLIYTIAIVIILRTMFTNNSYFYFFSGLKLSSFFLNMLVSYEFINVLQEPITILNLFIRAAFIIMFICYLTKELFTIKGVTTDTIKGGICIYIFIGILWIQLYKLTYDLYPASFFIQRREDWSFFYFSFNTLTTVGYDNITPRTSFAMILISLERVVGLLFLVIFLARLVGLHPTHPSHPIHSTHSTHPTHSTKKSEEGTKASPVVPHPKDSRGTKGDSH